MSSTPAKSRVTNVQVPGAQPPADTATSALPTENEAPKATLKPEINQVDMESMRAQIREEERAILRDELGAQMQAATTAASAVLAPPSPRSKHDYRHMRAADIDHTTLTAPVMTLDGYLCPPAPEAKK